MPLCICDPRPGGAIRDEWARGDGSGFYLMGEFLALEPFTRIVHVERIDLPQTTPDNHLETLLAPNGAGTLMTMRMTLPNATTRDVMLATGTESGMEASYARLERRIP